MEAVPWERAIKEERFTLWDIPSPARRSARTEWFSRASEEEHSNCFVAARNEETAQMVSASKFHTLQPETHISWFRWGLGAEAQTSEIKPRGEKSGLVA